MFGYSHASDRKAYVNTGYTQKNGAVSKVNKEFISRLTWAQSTPSAVATVQVSHALPAVHFSCLLRGQFPRWRRSRKRLSVCSVLRCPDLWLQCSVTFVHGLEKTHHAWCVFSKPCSHVDWGKSCPTSADCEMSGKEWRKYFISFYFRGCRYIEADGQTYVKLYGVFLQLCFLNALRKHEI